MKSALLWVFGLLIGCVTAAGAVEPPDARLAMDVPSEIRTWYRNPDGSCGLALEETLRRILRPRNPLAD